MSKRDRRISDEMWKQILDPEDPRVQIELWEMFRDLYRRMLYSSWRSHASELV